MDGTARSRSACWALRSRALLLGVVGASVLVGSSMVAQAASSARATSICSKVSAAAVSAIVGHSVPAPTRSAVDVVNHGISTVGTSCTFSTGPSLAALAKDVIVQNEVTSTVLTSQAIQAGLKTVKGSTFTTTAYTGLGMPGFYYTQTLPGGVTIYGMIGVEGTREISAAVYAPLSESKLAALVKLAEKL